MTKGFKDTFGVLTDYYDKRVLRIRYVWCLLTDYYDQRVLRYVSCLLTDYCDQRVLRCLVSFDRLL